jgi:hypothetical protein
MRFGVPQRDARSVSQRIRSLGTDLQLLDWNRPLFPLAFKPVSLNDAIKSRPALFRFGEKRRQALPILVPPLCTMMAARCSARSTRVCVVSSSASTTSASSPSTSELYAGRNCPAHPRCSHTRRSRNTHACKARHLHRSARTRSTKSLTCKGAASRPSQIPQPQQIALFDISFVSVVPECVASVGAHGVCHLLVLTEKRRGLWNNESYRTAAFPSELPLA